MKLHLKALVCAAVSLFAVFILCFAVSSAEASTIIKLDLGGTGPDMSYTGGSPGTFSTISDGNAGTTGDQNTSILYTGFLSALPATNGSYSLSGVTSVGLPVPLGGSVVTQNFSGGNFKLYDSTNVLLLDVNLSTSLLVGGSNGAVFNIGNGTVVGGKPSLTSQLVSNSIGFSISLTNISGGGLTISPASGLLNAFQADATKQITATQVPEPASILLAIGCLAALPMLVRRH
jgi:hypothetical protein